MPDATVPLNSSGQQQATAATGVDVISGLMKAEADANARAQAATQAATVPVSGGHILPQGIITPGAGHIYSQLPLDNSPVVGHKQAMQQGIANLSKSVANVVGQVQQAVDQKKTQALAVNIEHVMNAQKSIDQAKQILAQDPNNQAAKDQLQKSTGIMNEVLSDDKNRKAIAKAFNINFTDPSKNNTPEHAALKQAQDSYAQQFQDKLPQEMVPNQQAIATAQAAQAEAKATSEIVGKIGPAILAAQSRENVANTAAASRQTVAETAAKAKMDVALVAAKAKLQSAIAGANIHVAGMLKAVDMRDKTLLEVAQKRIDAVTGKTGGTKEQQALQKSFDEITKTLSTYQQNINLLEQNRKNANPQQVDSYNKQIQFYESQGKILQLQQEAVATKLREVQGTPISTGDKDGGAGQQSEQNTSTAVNYAPVSDTDDDPDDFDK